MGVGHHMAAARHDEPAAGGVRYSLRVRRRPQGHPDFLQGRRDPNRRRLAERSEILKHCLGEPAIFGVRVAAEAYLDTSYLVAALLEPHALDSVADLPGNNKSIAAEYVCYDRVGVKQPGGRSVQLEENRRFARLAHYLDFEPAVRHVITRARAGRRSLGENRAGHRDTAAAVGVGLVAVVQLPHRTLGEFRKLP